MLFEYEMENFKNAEELKNEYSKIYNELLAEKGKGEWQDEELHIFMTPSDFAKYEVFDGWYGIGYFAHEISGGR